MFIENVMRECNNFFMISKKFGTFKTSEINENGYYLIYGSLYNDGVHYGADIVDPEEFTGYFVRLAPPPSFVAIAEKIEAWNIKNPVRAEQSISVPNVSITYANVNGLQGWQSVLANDLKSWKKAPNFLEDMIYEVKDD